MAEKPSKNEFSLMKENPGSPKFNMSGNSQMTNHVGDNYFSLKLTRPDDQLPASALGALNETASAFSNSSKNETSVYEKLCDVVNKNTIQMTRVSVIEDFNKKKLNEPNFEVYPQMRRVNNYFEGGCEDWEESEIEITKRWFFRRPEKKVLRNQTRREMGFHFQKKTDDEETLTFPELLKSFTRNKKLDPDEVNSATAIVASAGSGKTTLIRRLARKCAATTLARNALNEDRKQADRYARFKMVHYMEIRSMKYRDDTDVSTFLFDGLYNNKEDEKKAYEWLVEHQCEAILYFDGLDQATWSIPTMNQRKITSFQRANTSEIMYNLLSRNLLPHLKIVITSREFKVSELPADARPDEIVTLAGFERHDAERLFVCLVGDRGVELWGKFQAMARRLINLISIPVFLVLTAALLAMDPDKPPPVTITELFKRIIMNLSQVENVQKREQIHDVIGKLKAMAHQGMVEGRVVFYESDLKTFGLSIEDVRDLMIKVPGNKLLSRFLVEIDYIFFVCHQSLQEFLSASFIAKMSWFDFFNFNRKHLHERRWSVVCMFVSGILFDQSEAISHEVPDMKKRIFCRQIQSRCVKESRRSVGLLAAIYESDNDNLIQSLPRLPDVRGTSLGTDGAHMFSSIWARRGNDKKEEEVNLFACSLNDELLDIMVQNLKDRKIRVGYLFMMDNSQLTAKGLKSFLAIFEVDKIRVDSELLKDFRYQDFDWKKIPRIHWDFEFSMINKRERIEFKGDVNGYFDKSPRTCETDVRLFLHISVVIVPIEFELANLFRQKVFQVSFKNQIFVEPSDLSRMKNLNLVWKIPKMLLDCRGEENVDSSLIKFCVEKFQVCVLDIVVNGEASFVPSNFLTDIESHIAINVNVHWSLEISSSNDVTELIAIVQQNQVENLRLCIGCSSIDPIKRVIENCKVKKLTLVYWKEEEKSKIQHDKIAKLGAQHSIEVDGVTWKDEHGTAWWKVH